MSSEGMTRRGFVEAVGISAGAASVLGAPAIGKSASANDKVRLGIIGAGSRGGQLLDSFLPQTDVELVAVADVDDRHAGETAERVKKEKGNTPETARDYRVDARPQGRRRGDHRHARPLARPARDPRRPGREGRLRREARGPQRGRGQGDDRRGAEAPTRSWPSAPSSDRRPTSRRPSRSSSSGKLGKVFWVQTWNYENISPTGMGRYPDSEAPSQRRLRPLARPGAQARRSTPTGSTCSSAGSSIMPAA